ncbi:hypothetical protein [Geomicrobium sp. JCM 19038]|uniref:hypothetical protein n=1 Tax=Geomicrobium sp. JCM 19038 TaxID=1460635 RepID=UPI00045F3CEE|nr:hypothetical protein [Geomicrobium sp. JCM 19038]GAK08022.1 hypothetical protein JCM19038_1785 [Geomicrobium sp. JCM 19038]
MDAKESIKRELNKYYRRRIALMQAIDLIDRYCNELEEELSYFLEFADDDLYFNQDRDIGSWNVEIPVKRSISIQLRIEDHEEPLNAKYIDVIVTVDENRIFKDVLYYNPDHSEDRYISETTGEEICNDLLNKYFKILQNEQTARQILDRFSDKEL